MLKLLPEISEDGRKPEFGRADQVEEEEPPHRLEALLLVFGHTLEPGAADTELDLPKLEGCLWHCSTIFCT